MIHYYYGDFKGKSTAAAGLLLRALGHNKKIFVTRFFKSLSGEDQIFMRFTKHVYCLDFKKWMNYKDFNNQEKEETCLFFEDLLAKIEIENPDFILFDEILYIIENKVLNYEKLEKWLLKNRGNYEIILTGRPFLESIFNICDYATSFGKGKHPYPELKARKGVEF